MRGVGRLALLRVTVARWRNHRRFRMVIALLAVLVASGAWGYAWAAKHVSVVIDGVQQECFSLRLTVTGILADAGVQLSERDIVEPGRDERVGDGGTISVKRAFPVVIAADGATFNSMTAQSSIAAALGEAGVVLGLDDRTEPTLAEPPLPGMTIRVVRVVREYQSELWRIARKVVRREDESLPLGTTQVVAQGKDGVEQVTFCTTYENGVKVSHKISDRVVVEEPATQTLIIGTSGTIVRDGVTITFRKAKSMTATAYYWGPECTGKYADGFTYCGLEAKKGVIAVDPRVIPLWTRVYVDGYGFAVAGDIGSAIKGNIIDLCYDTYPEAIAWGRRKVMLYIL